MRRAAGGLVVEVEDTGCGIAASDRDRVFHPFYTTREGGTGLGLAIVKQSFRLARRHGLLRLVFSLTALAGVVAAGLAGLVYAVLGRMP